MIFKIPLSSLMRNFVVNSVNTCSILVVNLGSLVNITTTYNDPNLILVGDVFF